MPLLTGAHVSTDVAVVDGTPCWWRHTTGAPLGDGTFDYWKVAAEPLPALEAYCGAWLRAHLSGYSGCVNVETIGGTIIEAHLRFADQWVDLYGAGWLESVVELYAHGRWSFADAGRRTGYSVVLFGRHGVRWTIDPGAVDELRRVPGVRASRSRSIPTAARSARDAARRLPARDRQLLRPRGRRASSASA
jgi:hypothetical protein